MSASLARTVFKPAPTAAARVHNTSSACPLSLFSSPHSHSRPSGSARTANAVAHVAVAAALFASAYSFASRPDSLLFDHPPRSSIGWTPSKHLAVREANAASAPTSSSSRPPVAPSSTSFSSKLPSLPAPRGSVASAFTGVEPIASELRLAGVLGRSIGQ
ncbi:hypothetical protein JCM6882_000995 [Rhodosporidiobolus microsporus]